MIRHICFIDCLLKVVLMTASSKCWIYVTPLWEQIIKFQCILIRLVKTHGFVSDHVCRHLPLFVVTCCLYASTCFLCFLHFLFYLVAFV